MQGAYRIYHRGLAFTRRYPLVRGMLAYAAIWPIGSCVQQCITDGKRSWEELDFARAARFSLFGSCYVAPTLYGWVKLSSAMWPASTLSVAITKALVEQVSYGPAAMIAFFFGMSLLECKGVKAAATEVSDKFWPTYKVGVCVWPVLQTINFSVISERNRVPFVSICSLIWTTFLSFMKQANPEVARKAASLT
ncbi:mpv17-like protein isoform X1 [Ischnura elegans]|uniref:mpv17-like protein isoform X1 n=2 Tax=Ischnura elegans TaxID=197161 RepID=UPI001ED88405|nr:mpv17-like protein isoform X1 [Ischnura elegans]